MDDADRARTVLNDRLLGTLSSDVLQVIANRALREVNSRLTGAAHPAVEAATDAAHKMSVVARRIATGNCYPTDEVRAMLKRVRALTLASQKAL